MVLYIPQIKALKLVSNYLEHCSFLPWLSKIQQKLGKNVKQKMQNKQKQ